MTDAIAFRLEREIRELAYDVRPASPQAAELRAVLLHRLGLVRLSLRADEALRLEVLIDRLCGDPRR